MSMPPGPPNVLNLPYPIPYRYWERWDPRHDNTPHQGTDEHEQFPGSTPLLTTRLLRREAVPAWVDYVIERANGERLWRPHKCINRSCGAPAAEAVVWIRPFYTDRYSEAESWEEGTPADGYRFFEMCPRCERTTSWPYLGLKPTGWKEKPLSEYRTQKDTQRPRLYEWENQLTRGNEFLRDKLTWEETSAYMRTVFHSFRFMPPKLRQGKGSSSWMRSTGEMSLTPFGQCRWVILHEAAHAIAKHLRREMDWPLNEAGHGRGYLTTYMALLHLYGGLPLGGLMASATTATLKWHDVTRCLQYLKSVMQPEVASKLEPKPWEHRQWTGDQTVLPPRKP